MKYLLNIYEILKKDLHFSTHLLFVFYKIIRITSMPKLKTNRAAAKRFHLTGTGKIKRSQAFVNHILTKKNKKNKRDLRKNTLVSDADYKRVRAMLSY